MHFDMQKVDFMCYALSQKHTLFGVENGLKMHFNMQFLSFDMQKVVFEQLKMSFDMQ